MIEKTCKQCGDKFTVEDADLEFYKNMSPTFAGKTFDIPPPTLCPECRMRRRMAWRNERALYNRKCDKSGKIIVSMYPPDSKFTIYSADEWWKDDWDATEYGQEIDFEKSFFEQFKDLNQKVPKCALLNVDGENSDYINRAYKNKDCYLSFDVGWNENTFYSRTIYNCDNVVDCYNCRDKSSYIYECVNCGNSNQSSHCISCSGISGCHYSYRLSNCHDCILCSNLNHKQYCIENKQYSHEEYEKIKDNFDFGSFEKSKELKERFKQMMKACVHKYATMYNCENCSGDNLSNCKNAKFCFETKDCEDCKYVVGAERGKDVYDDCNSGGEGCELNYETIGTWSYAGFFLSASYTMRNSIYCSFCQSCQDCFGCVGLRNKQYYIFNKKYSKEDYENNVAKLIEHMNKTPLRMPDGSFAGQEWGEFFPIEISEFAYNETVADDYLPMTKDQILSSGYKWHDKIDNLIPSSGYKIPDNVKDVNELILDKVLVCEKSKRPYKIQPKELAFYLNQNIPIPRLHPDQRYRERFDARNPMKLWHRKCMNEGCENEFETTYSPERPERVYCESCYQKTII